MSDANKSLGSRVVLVFWASLLALVVGCGGGSQVAPQITSQPLAASVVAPQTASFSVVANGTPAPNYQWQLSTDAGKTYADIAGATATGYTTPATTVADSGKMFRVHLSNSAGEVFSAAVTLVVTVAWSAPQLAPATVQTLQGVFSDGVGGVYVVGLLASGGVIVQRFNGATGWSAPATEMVGLTSVQAVELDQGVALFGRDAANWYRLDFTATGRQSTQTQFAVDYPNGSGLPPTTVGFTRAYDGAIVATSMVTHDSKYYVQTREFRGASWSLIDEASANVSFQVAGGSVDLVRSKDGDVATLRVYQFGWRLALRRPGEAVFTIIASAGCDFRYCNNSLSVPQLQPNGLATANYLMGPLTYRWLAADTNPARDLWPTAGASNVHPNYHLPMNADAARLVRADGSSLLLEVDETRMNILDGDAQAEWAGDAAQYAACWPGSYCTAAFSRPDGLHLATLQFDATNAAKLYISDRLASAQWSGSAAIDLKPLQAGGAVIVGLNYRSSASAQIIVAGAQSPSSSVPGKSDIRPFAVSLPAR